jgi:hypothetical protein
MDHERLVGKLKEAVHATTVPPNSLNFFGSLAIANGCELTLLVVTPREDPAGRVKARELAEHVNSFATKVSCSYADPQRRRRGDLLVAGSMDGRNFELHQKLQQFRKPTYEELRELIMARSGEADARVPFQEHVDWLVECGIFWQNSAGQIVLTELGDDVSNRLREGQDIWELRS